MVTTKLKNYESLFLFFILTWTLTSSAIYKSVMWTTNNPLFQNHNKSGNNLKSFCYGGDLLMKVHLKTILPVICPFEDLIMQPMESQPSSGVLYENLWIVYDKKSYDTCIINETLRIKKHSDRILQNKILHKCNKPAPLDNYFYRIDFSEYSPVPSDLYFEGMKTYYFLATSDGTLGSLNQKKGGHCDNDGDKEIRMKFKVYVCGTNETYTDPKCYNTKIGEFICEKPEREKPSPPSSRTTTVSPSAAVTTVTTKSPTTLQPCTTRESSSVCSCPLQSVITYTANITSTVTSMTRVTLFPSKTLNGTKSGNTSVCKCQTENKVNTTDCPKCPKLGGRTAEDSVLCKSRDQWLIAALFFLVILIITFVIMVIIRYRLKKKCSVGCFYPEGTKISCSTQTELPSDYLHDKNALVNKGFDGFDGVDGPKTSDSSKQLSHSNVVEMSQLPANANNNANSVQAFPTHNPNPNSSPTNATANPHNKTGNGYQPWKIEGKRRLDGTTGEGTPIKSPAKLPPIASSPGRTNHSNGQAKFAGNEVNI